MKLVAVLLGCAFAGTVMAADIRVLSAGAVEPGLVKVVDQFRRETGNRVRMQFFALRRGLSGRMGSTDATSSAAPASRPSLKIVRRPVRRG